MTPASARHRFRRFGAFALLCALSVMQAGFSVSPQVSPPPTEPKHVGPVTNLVAAVDGQDDGAVRLAWTEAENAQVHFVAYLKSSDLSAGNYGDMGITPFTGSQAIITDLDGGTPYHFTAIGMRWNFVDFGTVWGEWSGWVTATPSGPSPPYPVPIMPTAEPQNVGAVTSLTVAAESQVSGSVLLKWTEAENAQVHFVVYLTSADAAVGDFTAVRMAPFSGSEGVITELDDGTSYDFIVIGMRWNFVNFGAVWGGWSRWVSATPEAAAPAPVRVPGSVLIPDANLRAALEEHLGKTPGAPIFPNEMAALLRFEAADSAIRNLHGLQHATAVEFLDLSRNSISDISPLASLLNLSHLDLSGNNITDLAPLSQNEGLGSGDRIIVDTNPLGDPSFNAHIPALRSRGIIVEYDDIAFDAHSDPRIYNDNLFVLPVSENLVTDHLPCWTTSCVSTSISRTSSIS